MGSWNLPIEEVMRERGAAAKRLLQRPYVRFAGSAVLLAAALLLFPRRRVLASLRDFDVRLLAAALPVYLGLQAGSAFRWHLLVTRAGAGLRAARSFESYFAGLFGTLFLPSIIGGDAVAVTLAMSRAKSRAGVVAGAFLNRVLDSIALALLVSTTSVSAPQAFRGEALRLIHLVWAAGGAAAVAVAAGFVLLRPAWRPAAIDRILNRHREAFRPLRRPALTVLPLALSIVTQLGFALLSYRIGLACGVAVGPALWIFAWTLAKLVAFLPLTIAGIGARELALAALLAPFGVPSGTAVAAGLMWDVVVVTGSLASGAVWKLLARRNDATQPARPQTPTPTPIGS